MDNLLDSLAKGRFNLNFDFSGENSSKQDSLLQWVKTLDRGRIRSSRFGRKNQTFESSTNFLLAQENTTIQEATVTTDKGDYSPGETAFIVGSGFALGETVQLQVLHTDGRDNTRPEHQPWQITDGISSFDDAGNLVGDLDGIVDGNIETSWFVDPFDSLNSQFELTALGLDSGAIATTNFTDSYVISGTVFNDYDSDGVNDGTARGVGFASESGVEGITITAYNASEVVVGTATTGADGTYTLNINTDDPVRVEFTLPSGFVSTSLNTAPSSTVSDIAFASVAATMDLGIHRPHEVTSGDASSIQLITVCYVEGVGTGSGIVIHGYNDFDDQNQNAYTQKATVQEVGTVNGLAYHRESETLFAGSFYKRHSALLGTIDFTNDNNANADTNDATGAAYTSIIYTVDNSNANTTGNVSIFARLDDVVDPRGAIDSDAIGYSWESDQGTGQDTAGGNAVFDAVGKYGLGDLELSADGTTLWAVNLNDRKLYKVPVGDSADPLTPATPASADIDSYDLITDIINNGDDLGVNPEENIRPFALSIREGLVYFGMVNTAQYDADGNEGTPNGVGGVDDTTSASDLRAFVYTFDPENPTAAPVQVLDIPLDYERDLASSSAQLGAEEPSANWHPWVASFPTDTIAGTGEEAYTQPILSDIDFDINGNMLLGFRDRWGDQIGRQVNRPDGTGGSGFTGNSGGDLLVAILDPDTDTWTIETHVTTDNINGNNDPDGELFGNEFFENGGANDSNELHSESAQGGLTVVPGFTEVVTTAEDPIDAFAGGFEWFNTVDGSFAGHFAANGDSGLDIFDGTVADSLGKSNGLGDLEFIFAASDIEIGNRIWDDANQDGIQNADETNFDTNNSIEVELYDSSGTEIATTTTTNGEYYFSGLAPFTDYEIRLAASNFTSGAVLDGYLATIQNANSDGSDRIDSDATNNSGLPSITFTTGASGTNDYSFDFGLTNATTTDYGDAPDTTSGIGEGDYQTTAANTGASHTIVSGITIGSGISADDGTLQNGDATADSDDGVTFTSTLQTTDTSFSVDVDVNVTGSTTLVGWIDFDQSGTFDSDEAVSTTVSSNSTQTLTWNSFPGIIDGATYARFRLSTDGNLDTSYATGAASDGEVEDYLITVGLDYGDAPDASSGTGTGNYQTTSADTGASHGITTGLNIGSIVDPDNGTLQNTDADNDNTDGSDDEEGVTFATNLSLTDTTYSVDVDLTNSTGEDAIITGWIDFDQDGVFETSEAVVASIPNGNTDANVTLTWDDDTDNNAINDLSGNGDLPATILSGTTYARFRLSTNFTTTTESTTSPVTTTIYSEDFEGITDWRNDGSLNTGNTASGGDWAIGDPTQSTLGGTIMQPGDANGGTNALISDLSTADIDGGAITSRSDTFTLDSGSGSHSVNFFYFFSSFTSNVTDEITVDIVNSANTSDRANLFTDTVASDATQAAVWTEITQAIDSSFNGKTVYLEFTAQDGGSDDRVEAGVDDITVTYTEDVTVNVDVPDPLPSTGLLNDGEVEDYKINVAVDYGDAPDTSSGNGTGDYQTTRENDGASHTIDSDLSLGNNIDADDGTLQNTDATADDIDNTDDEDGVTFASNLEIDDTSYSVTLQVTNDKTVGSSATVVGWIDFDQDGIFESSEAVVATVPDNSTDATVTLTWDDNTGNNATSDLSGNGDLPATILSGTTYARFRLSTDGNLDSDFANGALSDGEVEDYKLTVGLDYGDARDTGVGTATGDYSTTANDNGPSHIIDSDLSIGSSVDADDGTLQNTGATADDDALNDGSTDDENGVTFSNTLRTDSTSYSVSVDIRNTTGDDAELIAWIDFDQSGTFDSDEAVTATFPSNGGTLQNQTLTWSSSSIPEDITDGDTYVRFRLSTDDTLDINYSTGQLSDGEVEDYEINIVGIDYADAPDVTVGETNPSPGEYATTLADGGASHIITDGLKLGATVDAENGTLQNTAATADDLDNNNDDDDEDGVTFSSTLDVSATTYNVTVDYTNDTGSNAAIIGWIDFDQSGSFDSDEQVNAIVFDSILDQNTTLTWDSFPGIISGTTYARFRLSTDYASTIFSEDFDDSATGWTVNPNGTDTATADAQGQWIIAEPVAHDRFGDGNNEQLEANSSPNALVTGSGGTNTDVDVSGSGTDGVTTVDSPDFTLPSTAGSIELELEYYLSVSAANDDNFTIELRQTSDDTLLSTLLDETPSAQQTGTWTTFNSSLNAFAGSTVYLRFIATDVANNSVIEVGVDDVNVILLPDATIDSVGSASDGEVEDYLIFIEGGTDFGDATNSGANDSYASTTTSHNIVSGLNLGSIIDNDTSPTANATADADDNNGTDDEDGVTFSSNLQTTDTTYNVTVDAVNTTGSDAELIGWIDFDQNGVFDADEASEVLTISASGQVTLNWTNIPAGTQVGDTYARFRLNDNPGNLDTNTPTEALDGGEVEDYLITITATDYGDAPDTGTGTGTGNYQTTENDDGAAHIIVADLSIGSTAADADDGTLQNNAATADNNDGTDDEDGVDFSAVDNLRVVDSAYSIDVDVINTTGNDAVLLGWIDFDQSGTFDSDEAVTATYSSNGGALQTQTLTWNTIPSDILPGTTYARFRISNDTTTLTTSYSTGLLSSGEVEDYQITIDAADYGDAPDIASGTSAGDYATTATDDGAAHGIDNNLRLGANLDADSGTLQNDDADADDTDGSPDDEDGVTSTLTDIATGDTSYSITLDVFNDTGSDAKLIGWIDFDRSGTFDSDEAVIRTIPTSGTSSSQALRWDTNGNGFTSSDISEGITYARFRLSTDTTTLTTSYSTGALTDGEVEDYQLNIIGVDYGDAPDDGFVGNSAGDYQTTEGNTGASHIIVDDLYLGGLVDADNGTLEDRDAIADDNDNTDDEDGVTFNNILNKNDTSYSVNLVVTNETGSDAKLVGWIDFDQDGDFEATEAVTQTISHAIGGQNTTLDWTGLSGIVGGTTYARFRLTADASLDLGNIQNSDSIGQFDSGEVEDYQLPVQGGVDYGDAPDTVVGAVGVGTGTGEYKTTLADGGASHTIVSDLFIGDLVDEDDGILEGVGAVADDNNGTNDEDGVNFLATLEAGDTSYSVTVDITNDTGSNATLVGWIDFDQDGNFEATEVATATVASNSSEQTATITWNSITPTAGETYARFRLSTDSALDTIEDSDSIGLLSDGEVEDYHVCVVSSGKGGTDGADLIVADPGGSVIAGYKGQDTLTGGAGVDSFCYSETSDGVDIVNGFTVGSGGDQIILTQILRDEVGYTGTDAISDGYVVLVDYGTTGTMVQIDFDGTGDLFPKDVALVVDTANADINETTLGANNLIF
ncbi:hypothetical protein Xen7305DRAFT_00015300 [Xenococcus sp. PCC 7305]|uniref:beta strand repeat-containing protein n=1 Tax=Xenococcus sp. PCC 7305 TaxID=102125 RepID=UPI0002ACA39F|nr:GEVED domain-containing protein [Xenococcus sp. PCC 7305]ELS01824.1 hypothetical protein Xen7305DRAFT_00015300 [Xenococcus sp. PCC 7305]